MKGSLGSSSRNSKFLKNLSQYEDITSLRKGLLLLSKLWKDYYYRDRLLNEAGLFTYSYIGDWGTAYSGSFRILGTYWSKDSITLKFLGWRRFLFLCSRYGLKAFTYPRSIPTFSWRLLVKSKLQNSPSLSWQQQSSSDFLETPTALAASERLIFFMPDFMLSKCNALHRLTNQIDSPIVLSLLLSFFSRLSSKPDSIPLSDSVLPAYSCLLLKRIMIICVWSKPRGIRPLTSAPILLSCTKLLISGSQMATLCQWSGQY